MDGVIQAYMVTSGEYSDYHVLGVFEDKATAEAWAGGCRVEEILFIKAGTPPKKVTEYWQHVELWDDGRVDRNEMHSNTGLVISMYNGIPPSRPRVRYIRAPWHDGRGGRLEVRGDSAEAVAKVVSERIAMWKAGAWAGPNHREIIEEDAA